MTPSHPRPRGAKLPEPDRLGRSRTTIALWVIGAIVAVFVLIQFVPYGHDHTDPRATNPFEWSSAQAAAIARRSCYDCHSNQTKWWWAIKIAPFSWLAQHDISEGRSRLNFSQWNGALSPEEFEHALDNGMPSLQYTLLHPNAKLTGVEKQQLVSGFQASLANQPPSLPQTSGATNPTAIIAARCATCHSTTAVLNYRASSTAQGREMLQRMIRLGTRLTRAQEQALVKYFTH